MTRGQAFCSLSLIAVAAILGCAPTTEPARAESVAAHDAPSDARPAPPAARMEPTGGEAPAEPAAPGDTAEASEASGPLPEAPAGIPIDVHGDGRCTSAEPICAEEPCDAPKTLPVRCPAIDWQPALEPTLHAAVWFTSGKPGGATERIDVVKSGARCLMSVLRLESRGRGVRRVYRETLDVDCAAVDEIWKTAEQNGLTTFEPLGKKETPAHAVSHGLLLRWEADGETQTHEVTWRHDITNERMYARFVRKLVELATSSGSLDLRMITPHWG